MLINVPVSIGELFDKISILDIKTKKIKNKDDLKLIKYELSKLKKIAKQKTIHMSFRNTLEESNLYNEIMRRAT